MSASHDIADAVAGLHLADIDEEALLARHRKERKEHQAKVQALKKSADKGDKKRKREVVQEIAVLDAALESRHDAEQQLFAEQQTQKNNGDHADDDKNDADGDDNHSDTGDASNQPNAAPRISKAQKRRDKKAQADRQLQIDILAQEELNKTGARTVETQTIAALLRARQLQLHSVASDGDCLYNAVAHQLTIGGDDATKCPANVADLRAITADYIEKNRDDLIVYMTNPRTGDCLNDAEFAAYCAAIRGTPTWGGQLEIKALSNALRVPIEVLQAVGPPTVQNEGDFGGRPLVLTYHRHMYSLGEHYNSTRPV